ncbi:Anaphase-promoting complex subunit 1 [Dimargaris xerosporica]|nr:Anaphase-promoting complex subunit 1 [Dimargaris xerosporica]
MATHVIDQIPRDEWPGFVSTFHLVYEELCVCLIYRPHALTLGRLLYQLATALGWQRWADYYWRHGLRATLANEPAVSGPASVSSCYPEPPLLTLQQALFALLTPNTSNSTPFPTLHDLPNPLRLPSAALSWWVTQLGLPPHITALATSNHLVTIYRALGQPNSAGRTAALYCAGIGWTRRYLLELSPAISIPILEAFYACRAHPPADLTPAALLLLDRPDLARQVTPHDDQSQRWPIGTGSGHGELAPASLTVREGPRDARTILASTEATADADTLNAYPAPYYWLTEPMPGRALHDAHHEVMLLKFSQDQRIREVAKLLRSHKPARLPAIAPASLAAQDDMADAEQRALQQVALRTLALPVGRALLQYGSTLPVLTETFPVPGLCLDAKFGPSRSVVEYQITDESETDALLTWPRFHDGVAAALSISSEAAALDSSWILLNQSHGDSGDTDDLRDTFAAQTSSPGKMAALASHAGWIYGLGLTGHLRQLISWQAFHYLATKHAATSVGMLLGLAAAYHGTGDDTVARLLAIHVPAFLPPNSSELQLSPLNKMAGIMGMGLLFAQTNHRRTVEVLVRELLSHRATKLLDSETDTGTDVTSHADLLMVGMSLGLVTLGRGRDAPGIADLGISDSLVQIISGNTIPSNTANRLRQPVALDGFSAVRTPRILPANDSTSTLLNDHFNTTAMPNTELRQNRPSQLHMAAATVAMTLLHLQSEDPLAAQHLALPTTEYRLRQIHPELAILRTAGQWLIQWSCIQPGLEWLLTACPTIGSIVWQRYCQSGAPTNPTTLPGVLDLHPLLRPMAPPLQRVYLGAVTGAALALGLHEAGTGHAHATDTLLQWYDSVHSWSRRMAADYESSLTQHMLRQSQAATLLAAAMVQAGTGHLGLLKRIRLLHGRLVPSVPLSITSSATTYGEHMLVHMALGMVFLGAGNYTLTVSSPMAIAALYCSCYPVITSLAPNDNQTYLQPLRHLWVLAVDARCVVARDVVTHRLCQVPLRITTFGDTALANCPSSSKQDLPACKAAAITTPNFVPAWSSIQTIEIADTTAYWPLCLDRQAQPNAFNRLQHTCTLWVLARTTPQIRRPWDSAGPRNALPLQQLAWVRPVTALATVATKQDTTTVQAMLQTLVQQFPAVQPLAALALRLLSTPTASVGQSSTRYQQNQSILTNNTAQLRWPQFVTEALAYCLALGQPDVASIYLALYLVWAQLDMPNTLDTSILPTSSLSSWSALAAPQPTLNPKLPNFDTNPANSPNPTYHTFYRTQQLCDARGVLEYYLRVASQRTLPDDQLADDPLLVSQHFVRMLHHHLSGELRARTQQCPAVVETLYRYTQGLAAPWLKSDTSEAAPVLSQAEEMLLLLVVNYWRIPAHTHPTIQNSRSSELKPRHSVLALLQQDPLGTCIISASTASAEK